MSSRTHRLFPAVAFLAAASLFAPLGATPQTSSSQSTTSASGDRWLHVRVISTNDKGDTVRVNVPLDLAVKVLPAIDHDRLHHGKVRIGCTECEDVDIRTLFDAVKSSKDGEFVTVQSRDADINVAKKDGQFLVHVQDKKKSRDSRVEVRVPMKVMEALLSAGKDELDLVAGLRVLSTQGDIELVSVKDDENTIRVWLDSKNVSD